MKANRLLYIIIFFLSISVFPQDLNPDTVKAQRFDMGRMWTFENPPLDYFREEYGFTPSEKWLEFVRKSALRFGNGCTASFISEDGLIMTNHHCARSLIPTVEQGDENFLRDGFFAEELESERKINGLFVDQLIVIKDVTAVIHSAMSPGNTETEKVRLRKNKISDLVNAERQLDSTLLYKIVPLYNGGKYSLYGYKRYSDIRLVFAPDLRTAKFGGDYDNFTYPRYGLDCTFLRAYENNKPIKTKYFFKWSKNGAEPGEAVFVIGNPGRTERISTVSQIEYARDIRYPLRVDMYKQLYSIYYKMVMNSNAEDYNLIAALYSIGNGLKVYEGTWNGLKDEYLLARKKAFEKQFMADIQKGPELKAKYSGIWDEIRNLKNEQRAFAREMYAYTLNPFYTSEYLFIANDFVNTLKDKDSISQKELLSVLEEIYPPDLDYNFQKELLFIHQDILIKNLNKDNPILLKVLGGKSGEAAVDYLLSNTKFRSREEFLKFGKLSPKQILSSDDPLIYFILNTQDKLAELKKRNEEIEVRESINNQLLGEALFALYGDKVPPDATGSLRISDGRLQSYSYNGTIAPIYTTFHGVLDRHNGFGKKFPYNLPDIWEDLPEDFNLDTKLNFISTNDITGGNSGSPVINKNGEIVGLAFDGNLESLPGDFIFTTEANRTVSVHSSGMIEGIRDLYKAERISDEILKGKIE